MDASPPRDATPFDGGPLPVVCSSSPCAVSLVTTLAASQLDASEGFCVLLDDGTVACWGANQAGQLGRGDDAGATSGPTAARVVGLSNVVSLDHTCALDKDGAVWCWGTGPFLQDETSAITTEHTPVKLPLPRATKMAIGIEVGCAAVDDGLLCWGANTFGQLAPFDSYPPTANQPPTKIHYCRR